LDLYATKGAINARLTPVVERLQRAGVSPDAVTLAAIPVAVVGGALLLGSPAAPALLLVVPFVVALRLLLNLLDGQLARRTNRAHPRGELFNEVGDRLADAALLAPVAFLPGAQPETTLLGVAAALLASDIGVASKAAGGDRIYRGVLSKPGRMVLLAVFCVLVFALGPAAWWWFGPLLLLGASLTVVERLYLAIRRLP
jgi:CDP-diacylglycerol--glycerol-3-phosphate 3-phosphatidyltransferase